MKIFTPRIKEVERLIKHGYSVSVADEIDLLEQLQSHLENAGDVRTALISLILLIKRSRLNEDHD